MYPADYRAMMELADAQKNFELSGKHLRAMEARMSSVAKSRLRELGASPAYIQTPSGVLRLTWTHSDSAQGGKEFQAEFITILNPEEDQ